MGGAGGLRYPPRVKTRANAPFFPSVASYAGRGGDLRAAGRVRVGVKKKRLFWRNSVFLC